MCRFNDFLMVLETKFINMQDVWLNDDFLSALQWTASTPAVQPMGCVSTGSVTASQDGGERAAKLPRPCVRTSVQATAPTTQRPAPVPASRTGLDQTAL